MSSLKLPVGAGHPVAFLTVFIWGTTFVSTKVLLESFSPLEILVLRFVLGFFALCLMSGKIPFRGFREERLFIGAGICGVTLYFLLENIALRYTRVSNVGIIVSAAPFFTALLSGWFLNEEKPRGWFYVGFALALSGIALLVTAGGGALDIHPGGDLCALLAAAVWACYSILMKKIGLLGYSTPAVTRRVFFYGLLFMIPALGPLGFDPDWKKLLLPVNYLNIIYLGLGASALCFASWNWAVKVLGAVKTGVYIYLVPVVTVVSSMLILHETIAPAGIAGIVLTLAGLVLSEFFPKRPARKRVTDSCTKKPGGEPGRSVRN